MSSAPSETVGNQPDKKIRKGEMTKRSAHVKLVAMSRESAIDVAVQKFSVGVFFRDNHFDGVGDVHANGRVASLETAFWWFFITWGGAGATVKIERQQSPWLVAALAQLFAAAAAPSAAALPFFIDSYPHDFVCDVPDHISVGT